jgi:hypothetical protein
MQIHMEIRLMANDICEVFFDFFELSSTYPQHVSDIYLKCPHQVKIVLKIQF